jgi:hypothetical protein
MLTETCIYTIKHFCDLRASQVRGGTDTYTEQKKWSTAQRLLNNLDDKRVPVIFAPAEGTQYLFAWALLDKVDIEDETTKFTFSKLRLIRAKKSKTLLKKNFGLHASRQGFYSTICNLPHAV